MMKNIMILNPRFIYKNFKGTVTNYNSKGVRNFSVILNEDLANVLKKDGWNIRYFRNRKDNTVEPYLKVIINYKYFNKPEIICYSATGPIMLDECQIDVLDKIDITKSNLVIRSYAYQNDEKSGIIAYLKTLDIKDLIVSDEFNLCPSVDRTDNDSDRLVSKEIKEPISDSISTDLDENIDTPEENIESKGINGVRIE